ncbi:succinate dehydrogenase, cytochrome b556 subunit [Sphingomonas sp. So64.6b]|uniref:succinate dehydrogenase, cytochrome b556 subunit n=1 Tax=Sphingomonas sp. So64.6b TaxID=2997354 RepID=UPI001FCE8365|nr:succinate dehydrogenase, cytochrome b556 subunit [Sphingomonas sp. So64.6b]
MTVSIIHRITGSGMATVGTAAFVWWLAALAGGKESYATFMHVFTGLWGGAIGYVVGIGLTLSFFQHMATGIRHFVLDTGAGYELKTNRMGAWLTLAASLTLTIVFWLYLLGGK